jgi:hypothetical protein
MLLTSSLHNIKISDTNCLLSVFHYLLIENVIAINVDTIGTNTMS